MGSGPVMSIEVLQVLYGVLHSMKGDTFLRRMMERAVEASAFAFTQLQEMDNEVDKLRHENDRLRKLLNNPPAVWSESDRLFVTRMRS